MIASDGSQKTSATRGKTMITNLNGTTATQMSRDEWLKNRQYSIGASEAAIALGVHPSSHSRPECTPLGLYNIKVGNINPPDATVRMRVGLAVEPLIKELYEEATGDEIECTQVFCKSQSSPFLTATIDGLTKTGKPVEFKRIHEFKARADLGEEGTDELPDHWIVQMLQQIHCLNQGLSSITEGDFAVLVGDDSFRRFAAVWDFELFDAIREKLYAFWQCVEHRIPPTVISAADAPNLLALYPSAGGTYRPSEHEIGMLEEWALLKEEIRERENRADLLKAQILERVGPRRIVELPGGRTVNRVVKSWGEHTRTVKAGSTHYLTKGKGWR